MARSSTRKKNAPAKTAAAPVKSLKQRLRRAWRWVWRLLVAVPVAVVGLVLLYSVANPPTTHTIWSEARRLGGVEHAWVSRDQIAPVMFRSVVAAEDANYCEHWGFDLQAIRLAIEEGAERGASTISQQVAKNVFLWQKRSWARKAMEAVLTPLVELTWSKRRILEVYLNVAEFGEGIFGVEAAARHYFRVPASELTPQQAARLAVLLPNPKARDPRELPAQLRRRSVSIADGAETIRRDGRAACFEG